MKFEKSGNAAAVIVGDGTGNALGGAAVEESVFGRYRLLGLVGSGGMGQVFRAFDTTTERVVAVKVLPPHLAQDDGFQRRFRREANAAAKLTEPHVVPIHGFGEIDGRLYVEMRLIEGRGLEAVVGDGPVGVMRAVGVVEQVAAALDAAHRVGLVHRDVKPSNIMLAERDFAYLIDFGIAREAEEMGLTNTGQAIGTLAYMAPERFATGYADPRSDIYALACVLYECVTGLQPYPGDSMEQQIAGHLTTPPPRPSVARAGVPSELDTVIATGMAKDPDRRYSSASALAQAARDAVGTTNPYPLRVPAPGYPAQPVTQLAPSVPTPPPAPAWHPGVSPDAATQYRPFTGPAMPVGPAARPWWRRPVVLGAAAAVTAAVVTAATILTVSSSDRPASSVPAVASMPTTAAAPPPLVAPVDIDTLMLNAGEVSSIMGIANMRSDSQLSPNAPYGSSGKPITPPECESVSHFATDSTYQGTGWTLMRKSKFSEPVEKGPQTAYQAVFDLPSPAAARKLLDGLIPAWEACHGQAYTGEWFMRDLTVHDDMMVSVSVDQDSTTGWSCQHVIAVAAHYVVEARACGRGSGQGEAMAQRILAKIPT